MTTEQTDLDGVLDTQVRLLYSLAQRFYPAATAVSQMHWNDLMMYITEQKPSNIAALCTDCARALTWYYELKTLPMPQPLGVLEYVGIIMSEFETALQIDYETD